MEEMTLGREVSREEYMAKVQNGEILADKLPCMLRGENIVRFTVGAFAAANLFAGAVLIAAGEVAAASAAISVSRPANQ